MMSLPSIFFVVDGNWGNWGSWSECSKSCGGGRQGRKRECNNPKPAYGGKACPGTSASSRNCNTDECPGGLNSLWFQIKRNIPKGKKCCIFVTYLFLHISEM